MGRIFAVLALIAAAALAGAWWVTAPKPLPPGSFAGLAGDAGRGERIFWAAGCAGCHAAPGAEGEARLILAGGRTFASPFGTFVAPNISPHPERGIGGWSLEQFGNALLRGVAPDGAHYYPAFPYGSYVRMRPSDVADLKAFMDGLPAADTPSPAHDIAFPYSIRRAVGVWKFLYLDDSWVLDGSLAPEEAEGRYLVEALAHCGECHTPRDRLGGLDRTRWMAGGPNPSGPGQIPNITPARLTWPAEAIAEYLKSGFTPEFDTAGGHMAEVVKNLANLPDADRAAIAAYLRRLPPVN